MILTGVGVLAEIILAFGAGFLGGRLSVRRRYLEEEADNFSNAASEERRLFEGDRSGMDARGQDEGRRGWDGQLETETQMRPETSDMMAGQRELDDSRMTDRRKRENVWKTEERGMRDERALRKYQNDKWQNQRRGYEKKGKKIWSVGSPVSGTVSTCREGAHPMLVIQPSEEKLYAPVGGKVVRLYPLGNAISFLTEFGTEIYIQVGEVKDELLGCHFRPRVIQNEVVNKGKMLLEFDGEALEEEGESTDVTIRVVNNVPGEIINMTAGEYVKNGEEIFEVSEPMVTKART